MTTGATTSHNGAQHFVLQPAGVEEECLPSRGSFRGTSSLSDCAVVAGRDRYEEMKRQRRRIIVSALHLYFKAFNIVSCRTSGREARISKLHFL